MSSKNKRFLEIIIVLLCLVLITSVLAFNYLMPKLKIYNSVVNVNIYSDYIDNNYKATFINKDISDKVTKSGIIDTNNLGSYKVSYNLKYSIFDLKKDVTVNVVDSIAPIIELKGDKDYKVCSINTFEEPGFDVYDNYDNDLNDKVESNIKENQVIYQVKDSNNNVGRNVRNLIVTDDEKPKITLNGNATQFITINTTYEEKGAKAEDNCDGNLTDKIKISGSVDTSKTGTYEITYEVSDNTGNTTTTTRKVIVQEKKNAVVENDTNNDNGTPGVIYMTFDDGPGSYTNQILDILAKYNIKATFFVTNAGSDNVILREYNEGHTVALHTATHDWKIYKSVETYFADLDSVKDRVKRITGYEATNIRFPGGSSNTISKSVNVGIMSTLVNEVEARGYKYFDWNVCVEDAGACAKSGVKDRKSCVLNYFKKYISKSRANYVLLHDIKSYTAAALEDMIKYALANNYTFLPITEDTPAWHHKVNN